MPHSSPKGHFHGIFAFDERERLLSKSCLSPVGFTISLGYRSGYLMILRFGRHDGPAGTSIWRRSRVLLIYRPVTGIKHKRVSIY